MKHSFLIIIFFFLMFSCNEPEARRPKNHSTTNFYKELIKQNKKLNAREKRFLESLIAKDTIHKYIKSPSGFWYYYNIKDSLKKIMPKLNDIVTIQYDIKDVNGVFLYPVQQKNYKVDKEDFIPALQDGIKLMKQGETITFVIPSFRAFGVMGDEQKIGMNQPITSTVTLINIKQSNNEN